MLHKMERKAMHYSATEMAKKLDISRSYLYYLKKNNVVEIQENEQGHPIWNDAVYEKLYHYIRKNHIKNKIHIITDTIMEFIDNIAIITTIFINIIRLKTAFKFIL